MPAVITPTLQSAIQQSASTLVQCFKLTRVDGTVIGYTNHTSNLVIDGVTYVARPGITPSEEALSADLAVDNVEVQAIFDNSAIKKADVLAGLYDRARFQKFVVDYTNPSGGTLVRLSGFVAEVKVRSDGIFNAQLLSLNDVVRQNPLEIYCPICRAILGDSRCKVNLAGNDQFGDPITVTGAVTTVLDGLLLRSNVVFQNASGGGAGATNQFVRSLAGTTFGGCGAASVASLASGNGFIEAVIPDSTTTGACGFSLTSAVSNITNIQWGFKWSAGSLWIVLAGIQSTKLGSISSGDKIRVAIEGTDLKLYKNDIPCFMPSKKPTISGYPFFAGVAIATSGAKISNVVLAVNTGGNMRFVDSSRTEVNRTFPSSISDPTLMQFRQFANGNIRWTSGSNNGLTMTIKDWDDVNKTFTLNRPSPFTINIGDTYVAVKGCNQLRSTCTTVYANTVNGRFEPDLPGPEKVLSRP